MEAFLTYLLPFLFYALILAFFTYVGFLVTTLVVVPVSLVLSIPKVLFKIEEKYILIVSYFIGTILLYVYIYDPLWLWYFEYDLPLIVVLLAILGRYFGSGLGDVKANEANKWSGTGEHWGLVALLGYFIIYKESMFI